MTWLTDDVTQKCAAVGVDVGDGSGVDAIDVAVSHADDSALLLSLQLLGIALFETGGVAEEDDGIAERLFAGDQAWCRLLVQFLLNRPRQCAILVEHASYGATPSQVKSVRKCDL